MSTNKRYAVNEFCKINDELQIRVHAKKKEGSDTEFEPAKTFWIKMGFTSMFLTPDKVDTLVQQIDAIKEFVESHRDLVLGTAERKAENKAKYEQIKVKRQEEARVKAAVENVVTGQVKALLAEGNPETLAALAALMAKKTA